MDRCQYFDCHRPAVVRLRWDSVIDGAGATLPVCAAHADQLRPIYEQAADVTAWQVEPLYPAGSRGGGRR